MEVDCSCCGYRGSRGRLFLFPSDAESLPIRTPSSSPTSQTDGRCGVRRHAEDGAQRFPAAIAFPECALRQRSGQDLATDDPSGRTKLTPEVARELCQRAGSKAYLAGSIGSLGSEYVLGLKAVNCQSGDTLAEEQVTAASKEKVLDALGEAASKLRGELGESLATVQKFDVPLEQATTSSLEALKAYSLGQKAFNEKGPAAALPYHQRAIELDPNFAMGYWAVGDDYSTLGELGRASEYFTKAFQLREHASEREKLAITADYYRNVTGELDKAAQTFQEEIESYPRDTPERMAIWASCIAHRGSMRKPRRSRSKACALHRIVSITTPTSPTTPLPCSASMKRGRSSTRRRRENWIISYSIMLSTLLLFSGRTPRRWRNSNSGLRASPSMRTLDCRSHPTPRRTLVIWARRGN